MNTIQTFLLGSAVLTLSSFSVISSRTAAYADAQNDAPGSAVERPRMHRMFFAAEAPLISIALKHQAELNLSPDQVSTLEKIRTQYRDQATPIHQQLQSMEKEIKDLVQESPANLVQAKVKIEQAEKLRSDLRYRRIEALENGKSLLTADQKEQLKNLFASMRQNFRRSRGQAS
jgi:Spy/CpxP family protein refolding chaperone